MLKNGKISSKINHIRFDYSLFVNYYVPAAISSEIAVWNNMHDLSTFWYAGKTDFLCSDNELFARTWHLSSRIKIFKLTEARDDWCKALFTRFRLKEINQHFAFRGEMIIALYPLSASGSFSTLWDSIWCQSGSGRGLLSSSHQVTSRALGVCLMHHLSLIGSRARGEDQSRPETDSQLSGGKRATRKLNYGEMRHPIN